MSNERVENCMKCPQYNGCVFDTCNMRYMTGTCPVKGCELLNGNLLKGLPEYCKIKDTPPFKCPILANGTKEA